MSKAKEFYNDNIIKSKEKLKGLEKTLLVMAIIRLTIVVLCIVAIYFFYRQNNIEYMVYSFFVSLVVFIIVAFFHNNKINEKRREKIILEYNEKGIKRLNGKWKSFQDIGEEYIDINHNFTSDLDIFGTNSLFQWINTTNTKFGREALAKWLQLKKLPDKYEIQDNQDAIKELTKKREFAQNIYLQSYVENNDKKDIQDILIWSKTKGKVDFTIKYVPYLFIAITTICIFLTISKRLSFSYLLLVFAINYLVVKLLTRRLSDVIHLFIKHKQNIIKYSNVLRVIQEQQFESKKLKALQKKLINSNVSCKDEMNKLKNIINWIGDSQSNALYLIINVIILSDVFILKNLEHWREINGEKLEEWLKVMGEFEAILSLSNLAFEHDEWKYPKINYNGEIIAKNIAHPTIGERAIGNNFELSKDKKVALITGSNMSGKSTFLRTIGINIILTYLGLPTNSKEFSCGIYNIYTCMRTQDNLEESISSFYAEILRIKLLIDAGKKGEEVFFLLDEIFKGTNSVDRHDGAKILIHQLANNGALGLVSTHDLELCDLENSKPWLINFNFREYYEDGKIKFDYNLRNGKSKTQNAKHLMKLAGIDID